MWMPGRRQDHDGQEQRNNLAFLWRFAGGVCGGRQVSSPRGQGVADAHRLAADRRGAVLSRPSKSSSHWRSSCSATTAITYFSLGGGIGVVYQDALASGSSSWWRPAADQRPITPEAYARRSRRCSGRWASSFCSSQPVHGGQRRRAPRPGRVPQRGQGGYSSSSTPP